MEKLSITYMGVDFLRPSPHNPRKHTEKHIAEVVKSIKYYGFLVPILLDEEGYILAGHCRLIAAKKIGMKEVPTVSVKHLTDIQRRAFIIAENQFTINGEFDLELLKGELIHLKNVGVDLELTGFSDDFFELAQDLPELDLDSGKDEAVKYLTLAYTDDELLTVKKNLDRGVEATGCDDYAHLIYQLVLTAGKAWTK